MEIVELLISNGADVNAIDQDGNAPLHFAVRSDSRDVVKLLIDNFALVHIVNKSGETPFDSAGKDMADLLAR